MTDIKVIKPTQSDNAEGVSAYPCAAEGGLLELLGPGDLLSLLDHVGQPVGAAVEVEDEAGGRVGHLLHPVPGDVAHGDAHLAGGLQTKQKGFRGFF